MGAKLNLEKGYITPLVLPFFGAKYNLEGSKVQGFGVDL